MSKKQLTEAEKDAKKRKLLFKPCKTEEELRKWIWLFLDLDMPNSIVDPDSNCTPMGMIWEVYSKALANDDPNFNRVLYFASRSGMKTLSAAILEVLAIFHLDRSVGHMAALENQSIICQGYVKGFINKRILRDFKTGDNLKQIEIVHYYNKEKDEHLTEKEFKALPAVEQDNYKEIKRYIKIVVCTMRAANGEHVNFFVTDEIDVVADERAYYQAMAIPDTINGKRPISILTSTRKFAIGLVQREIDNAIAEDGETKLHIRHWNAIDVTERCKTERCRSDLPKIPIYVNEKTFVSLSEDKYNSLLESDKAKYTKNEGYQGCLTNCKLFAVCKGRLHTEQKSNSKLLKPIDQTITQIRTFTPEMVEAELLSRKPSSEGLIYPHLERSIHVKTAGQMAEMLLGHPVDGRFGKKELIQLLKQRGDWNCYAGMDFGFSHNFAVVTGFADGYRCFILDVIAEPNLLPDRQVDICNKRIKKWNPQIFADTENPQAIQMFRVAGFRMKKWVKGPGSLIGGIDAVRLKLREPLGEPTLFFLADDPGVELLFKRMSSYHWKLNAQGQIGDQPDEKDDDECDALRYLIMNKFAAGKSRSVQVAQDSENNKQNQVDEYHNPEVWTKENFYQKVLEKHGAISGTQDEWSGSDGSFKWIF